MIESLAQAQSSRGEIGWWRLEETSGTVAADDCYQGDGTYIGGLTLNGAAGVVFDGTSGRIETPITKDINQQEWTVVARIKAGATAGAVRTLISKGPGGLILRINATNRPEVAIGGGAVLLTAPTALIAGVEHVICAMYGPRPGGLLYIFVDGGQVAAAGQPSDPVTTGTTNPWTIGAYIDAGGVRSSFFNGTMLDAAIWNRAWLNMPAVAWAVPDWFYRVPSILTTWRDPAAPTAPIGVELPINAISAAAPLTATSVSIDAPPVGTAWVTFANSRGLFTGNAAGPLPTLSTTMRVYEAGGATQNPYGPWPTPVTFALPRLVPNIRLGYNARGLTAALAMIGPDRGVAFIRAATGPNAGDFAPGSSWVLASSAGSLTWPANTVAFLAVQLQLERQSPQIGMLLERLPDVAPLPEVP